MSRTGNVPEADLTSGSEDNSDVEYDSDDVSDPGSTWMRQEAETEVDAEAFHFECLTLQDVESTDARVVKTQLEAALEASFTGDALEIPEQDESSRGLRCPICQVSMGSGEGRSLRCGHEYCAGCWTTFLEVQVNEGLATGITCLRRGCETLALIEFVLPLLARSTQLRTQYSQLYRDNWTRSHPQMRLCPNEECWTVIKVDKIEAKRVQCAFCETVFCCKCGGDYHLPASCDTIVKWKSEFDELYEVAEYVVSHTKDCPKCRMRVERDGESNVLWCTECRQRFCWVCLDELRRDPGVHSCRGHPRIRENDPTQIAREDLEKFRFYCERWLFHGESRQFQEVLKETLLEQIERRFKANEGTWIDWRYLLDAAELMADFQRTLQYTYPVVHFQEDGTRKNLLEFQLAMLEEELESFSWKVQHADTCTRGELATQMAILKRQKRTLLEEFLDD